jgi:cardiolipin synthase (CMP-forming)
LRWLPHFLTLLRFAASPIVALLLYRAEFRAALLVALVAGLTDWFDGYTARKLGATGRLGTILDPLADKTLLVTLFFVLGLLRMIPLWLLAIAVGRDLVIVGGAVLLRIFRNRRNFVPSWVGKVSTFFQIVLVLLVLIQASFPNPFVVLLRDAAVVLTTIFTLISWFDYVRLGIQMTRSPALQNV